MLLARRELNQVAGKFSKKLFNPNSNKDLHWLFFGKLKVEANQWSPTGAPSLNDNALVPLVVHHRPLVQIAARALLRYRRWKTLLRQHVERLPLDQKNVVHPTWKIYGAITGRWASTSPNVMNIPKPRYGKTKTGKKTLVAPGLRDLYIPHKKGNIMVEADYSQLELRIIALLAGDQILLDAYAKGQDVHSINARTLFCIPEGEEVSSTERRLAKGFVYGANYGGQAPTIWEALSVDFPNIQLNQVVRMLNAWNTTHFKIVQWQKTILKKAYKEDFVEAPLSGRRRYFHGGVKPTEVFNFPIQATAADLLNRAILKLRPLLDWPNEGIIFQCHDALICDGPNKKRLAKLLKDCMEQEITVGGRTMKFNVDIKSGPSWGEMEE
jgi:DNA polymerase-1